MQKKLLKFFFIIAGTIGCIWIIGRITGAIQLYFSPTSSSIPTLPVGDYMLNTNLVKPSNGDFISFRTEEMTNIFIFRLCGMPGDTIEMRNKVFYINGDDFDKNITTSHSYNVERVTLQKIKLEYKEGKEYLENYSDGKSFSIHLSDKIATKYGIKDTINNTFPLPFLDSFNKEWNGNDFGPLVVPDGEYFVLGDSRDNAMDSRYYGYINQEDVIDVMFFQFYNPLLNFMH